MSSVPGRQGKVPGDLAKRSLRGGGPALLAGALTALPALAGWQGTDWAAQVYRSTQAARYGLVLWDPGWYGGTYPLNYSVVYPLAAGHLGLWVVAGVSAAFAAACFDRLVSSHFGRRPLGSWYFAASTLVEVAIGQLPMLSGEALGLGALLALHQRRRSRAAAGAALAVAGLAMAVLTALCSPLAGAFLALALVAWGLADVAKGPAGRPTWARPGLLELSGGALTLACTAALPLVFPGAGYFPFGQGDLAVVLLISALLATPLLRPPLALRAGACLYGLASVALFAVRTQVGDNDARLAAYLGVPLALCFLGPVTASSLGALRGRARGGLGALAAAGHSGSAGQYSSAGQSRPEARGAGRRRALAVGAAATVAGGLLVSWHWSPVLESLDRAANGPPSKPGFYRPLIKEARSAEPVQACSGRDTTNRAPLGVCLCGP